MDTAWSFPPHSTRLDQCCFEVQSVDRPSPLTTLLNKGMNRPTLQRYSEIPSTRRDFAFVEEATSLVLEEVAVFDLLEPSYRRKPL